MKRIEIHALQTLPPAAINRDRDGYPKTVYYGGVQRLRVSSQAWKAAMRWYFRQHGVSLGVRTRLLGKLLEGHLQGVEEAEELTRLVVSGLVAGNMERSNTLLFLKSEEIESLAQKILDNKQVLYNLLETEKAKRAKKQAELEQAIREHSDKADPESVRTRKRLEKQLERLLNWEEKVELPAPLRKELETVFTHNERLKEVDIALFGRLLAEIPNAEVEGAMGVAHAIGVEPYRGEIDMMIALDDLLEQGAFLGERILSSATVYRYAVIEVAKLRERLGETAPQVAALAVRAFALSFPKGGRSMAPQTVPSLLAVAIDQPTPLNLVGAFEAPITPANGVGVLTAARKRLLEHWERNRGLIGTPRLTLVWDVLDEGGYPEPHEQHAQLEGLLKRIVEEA